MAKYQVNCSVCGSNFERVLFGPGKDREWKLNQPQTCPDCWEKQKIEKREKANAEAREFGKSLPALDGSEKQIAWAESLRKTAIEKVEKYFAEKENPELPEAGIVIPVIIRNYREIPNAKFWIENRDRYAVDVAIEDFQNFMFAK
jgi:hypothetical protein